jgi:hypothetical protein
MRRNKIESTSADLTFPKCLGWTIFNILKSEAIRLMYMNGVREVKQQPTSCGDFRAVAPQPAYAVANQNA